MPWCLLYPSPMLMPHPMLQLVLALEDLHDLGLAHRDLRPGKVLLDGAGNCKLADLKSACAVLSFPTRRSGTPGYRAPEVLTPGERWGLRCVLVLHHAGGWAVSAVPPPHSPLLLTGSLSLAF